MTPVANPHPPRKNRSFGPRRATRALARARIMGARYPYYLLADSKDGQLKEAEVTRTAPSSQPTHGNIRHGFVYERVPHVTLKSIANNAEIDNSIAAKAEFEFLYDKPYDDKRKVRVAGPFTVESLSPHRVLGVDENDELIDTVRDGGGEYRAKQSFPQMILDNLKVAGVQQAHKEDRITFTALTPWPGDLVCAEGRYLEGEAEKRAAIFMAEDLKNTGKGNLFVIFGEPDITLLTEKDRKLRVKLNGVDVFKPQTGEVVSDGAEGIACWFIDTDYNEESFFVRQAYFLGANDPYSSLKTTLKAEIDLEAWESLHSDTSRAFAKPGNGRIAVKVINHLGDEVMKVFRV